uniref:Uncharacterized protein n=1 Tax=Amphilophus citrinellus TaxID=61819 RepID=A0A3Q0S2A1_AMPCI
MVVGRHPGINLDSLWSTLALALGPRTAAGWTSGSADLRSTALPRWLHLSDPEATSTFYAPCLQKENLRERLGREHPQESLTVIKMSLRALDYSPRKSPDPELSTEVGLRVSL